MKIISWNINGIRAVEKKGSLTELIGLADPDIIFFQEIKAKPEQLSEALIHPENYVAHYNPAEKPGYAGTGAWVHKRVMDTSAVRFMDSFPEDPTGNEGRVAHLEITKNNEHYDMFGIYFPNGGKSEEAWQGKLVFYSKFANYINTLRNQGHHVLWGGDLNCAHNAIDLARPRENDGKIGFHPLERAWFDNCVNNAWHDIWRAKNPGVADVYSWWDVVTKSRSRNVGWRIDAWWGSDIFFEKGVVHYMTDQLGSDHCPISIDIEI